MKVILYISILFIYFIAVTWVYIWLWNLFDNRKKDLKQGVKEIFFVAISYFSLGVSLYTLIYVIFKLFTIDSG